MVDAHSALYMHYVHGCGQRCMRCLGMDTWERERGPPYLCSLRNQVVGQTTWAFAVETPQT